MKPLHYLYSALITSVIVVFASNCLASKIDLDRHTESQDIMAANQRFPSSGNGWTDAYINPKSHTDTSIRVHSGKLFDNDYDIHFRYQNQKHLLHDDEIAFLNRDYYEIDSRIKGDWGNITLSFQNSQTEGFKWQLSPTYPIDIDGKQPWQSTVTETRTNGHGSVNLYKGVGLKIEMEYLTIDNINSDPDINLPTLAYSADLNAKFGSLNTRTVYFHMDRNHDINRYWNYSLHPYKERGFRPLYILTGTKNDIFLDDGEENNFATQTRKAGMDGIAFVVDYKATPRIKLHTAVGAANTDKTPHGQIDNYGWEANLGLGYDILDNLTYELHLGYMATGDFFEKEHKEDIEPEDITIVTQHLTLKF